jgi:hypothetical protein
VVKEAIDVLWEDQMNQIEEDDDTELKKEILKKDRTALTSRLRCLFFFFRFFQTHSH